MGGDILIKHARVWPSADKPVLEDGMVLIREGRITRVGRFHARAEVVIDADGCLLMPGLVQAHVHLCQTLFRGLAEDRPRLPWREAIWPLVAAHDEPSIRVSALLGCAEMIRGGVTAFLSMETVRHTGAVFAAADEAGLSGTISYGFMDESCGYAPLAMDIEESLAECDVLRDKWGNHERLALGIGPQCALSCTRRNLKEAAAYAREYGLILHTHSSEQQAEAEEVRRRTGMSPLAYLDSILGLAPDVCLAHCVHMDRDELALLVEKDARILHCPTANLKLGAGVANVPVFLEKGLTVALGSDSAPCNNRLDIFAEMRQAALVQKPLFGPDALPAPVVVDMATRQGCRVMGWKDAGAIEEGLRANLILVDTHSLHVVPSNDSATDLVYSQDSSDVVMTMVDGRILFEDGRVTTVDENQLKADAAQERARVLKRAGLA